MTAASRGGSLPRGLFPAALMLIAGLTLQAALPRPGLAATPPTQAQLDEAERTRAALLAGQKAAQARAASLAATEKQLATDRVAAAARLRALETETAALAGQVAALRQRRDEARQRLLQARAQLAVLLPVVERLGLYPAETLVAAPVAPEQSVRGVLVLRALILQLQATVAAVSSNQADMAGLQRQLAQATAGLSDRIQAQAVQAAALEAQIAAAESNRRLAEGAAADAARRAALEAARADNLRSVIARLTAERQLAEAHASVEARQQLESSAIAPGPGAGRAPASLVPPVAGLLVRGFGAPIDGGQSTGLAYQAQPGAQVVSPCGGRVVFSGPFRSFGLLLIVDCGGGWHVVLTGLDRLDAAVGQLIPAGEPVGRMAGFDPQGAAARPLLSMELRRDGRPVNPAPLLRARS